MENLFELIESAYLEVLFMHGSGLGALLLAPICVAAIFSTRRWWPTGQSVVKVIRAFQGGRHKK